jgi:hypothetical protein
MSFRFSLPCHCDLLAPTTGTTSDCVHPNSLHLRSNQKVAIQQLDSEGPLAARGDPSCMIGISETPGASNRVGKKVASVGELIHTSASRLVLVQERPLRAAGAYGQTDRDAGGHALSVGASG